jgi:hypothetical protein
MSLLGWLKSQDPDPPKPPQRLPHRWAIILGLSVIGGFAVGRDAGLAAGVTTAIALAVALNVMLE